VHWIFQRQGIPPDEIYNKPPGTRAFMYASAMIVMEEEDKAAKKAKRKGAK
jgi:hypothetical protein